MKRIITSTFCAILMAVVVVLLALPLSAAEPLTGGWLITLPNFVPNDPVQYNLTTIQYNGGDLRYDDFYITDVVIVVTNEDGQCYRMTSESAYSNSNLNRLVTPYGWIENGATDNIVCVNADESVAFNAYAGTSVRIYYKSGSINPYGAGSVTYTPYATNFNETVGPMVEDSYQLGYNNGYQNGMTTDNQIAFNEGYATAIGELEDGEFASNFLGDVLFAPIKAINDFQLFQLPGGTVVTLGGLFFVGLSLCLIFLVLRYFAGG